MKVRDLIKVLRTVHPDTGVDVGYVGDLGGMWGEEDAAQCAVCVHVTDRRVTIGNLDFSREASSNWYGSRIYEDREISEEKE